MTCTFRMMYEITKDLQNENVYMFHTTYMTHTLYMVYLFDLYIQV